MDNIEKEVRKYLKRNDFETCLHCSFYPGGGSSFCFAPWTDLVMEEQGIDPCREGVYLYLSGDPVTHLKKLLEQGIDCVWIREKGEFVAKDPDVKTDALRKNVCEPKEQK